MDRTQFAGLTRLGPGDPLTVDGGSFLRTNPTRTDYFLRIGALTHRHDAHPQLADPVRAPSASVVPSGGQIPGNVAMYLGYTLVDSYGGETRISGVTAVTTPSPPAGPSQAIAATFDSAGGTLPVGQYGYAISCNDAAGGETVLGPTTFMDRPAGFASGRAQLAGLATGLGGSYVSWNVWRMQNGAPFQILATGTADTFTDTGLICTDAGRSPQQDSTHVLANNAVAVTVPTVDQEPAIASATSMMLYLSTDGTFTDPCLYAPISTASAGVVLTIARLAVSTGAPPTVSLASRGADLVNPDTDLLDWHWKRPAANYGALGSGTQGDVRLALDTGQFWVVLGASAATPTDWSVPPGQAPTRISVDELGPFLDVDFLAGSGITLSVVDAGGGSATVTINASGIGGSGSVGPQGPMGASGAPGPQGDPGPAGASGAPGSQGPAGASGAPGASGAQGPPGASGAQGPPGASGAPGPAGTGSGAVTGVAVGGSAMVGPLGGRVALAFAGSGGTGVAVQDLGGGSAQILISASATGGSGSVGPQGGPGASGAPGPAGASGAVGPAGASGAPGAQGPAGSGLTSFPASGGTGSALVGLSGMEFVGSGGAIVGVSASGGSAVVTIYTQSGAPGASAAGGGAASGIYSKPGGLINIRVVETASGAVRQVIPLTGGTASQFTGQNGASVTAGWTETGGTLTGGAAGALMVTSTDSFGDGDITAKLAAPTTNTAQPIMLCAWPNENTKVWAIAINVGNGTQQVGIFTTIAGVTTQIQRVAAGTLADPVWLRLARVGATYTATIYSVDPTVGSPTPMGTVTFTATTGPELAKFGPGVTGFAGLVDRASVLAGWGIGLGQVVQGLSVSSTQPATQKAVVGQGGTDTTILDNLGNSQLRPNVTASGVTVANPATMTFVGSGGTQVSVASGAAQAVVTIYTQPGGVGLAGASGSPGIVWKGAYYGGSGYVAGDAFSASGSSFRTRVTVAPGASERYIGSFTANGGGAGTDVLTLPAGTLAGDLLLVQSMTSGPISNLPATQGSLIQLASGAASTNGTRVWYKVATAADITTGSVSVTTNSNGHQSLLRVYRNVGVPYGAVVQSADGAATSSILAPLSTAVAIGDTVVQLWTTYDGSAFRANAFGAGALNASVTGGGSVVGSDDGCDLAPASAAGPSPTTAATYITNAGGATQNYVQTTLALPGLFPGLTAANYDVLAASGASGAPGTVGPIGASATLAVGASGSSPILGRVTLVFGGGTVVTDLGGGSAGVCVPVPVVAASGGASAVSPDYYTEYAGSGGVGVAVQNMGGGSARVLVGLAPTQFYPNRIAPPIPVGGGVVYVSAGALHFLGSSGTDTVIAPA